MQPRLRAGRLAQRLSGLVWTAVAVTIFSGWFVVTHFSMTRALGIWDITALRFGIGALLLAPVLRRRRKSLSKVAWAEGLGVRHVVGRALRLTCRTRPRLTSAAQAAWIAPTLMPLFADLFAWAFLRERQGRQRWPEYTGIFVGLSVLVSAGAAVHGPPNLIGLGALVAAGAM